ncbi:hypothetical protein HanIR_Chr01g0020821 [Helianthus annuus]|nr:hypothetical protein HanIR_Chr01g0020821 [Helianthus annuus]
MFLYLFLWNVIFNNKYIKKHKRVQNFKYTDNSMCSAGATENSSEPKITNLYLSQMTINKNVVTLKVSMDHGRVMTV